MTPEPPIGTIICVDDPGLFNWVEKLVTRSHVSHTIIYVGGGRVVEAQAGGARLSPLEKFTSRPQCDNAPQAAALPPGVGARIASIARGYATQRIGYNFLDLLALLLRCGFGLRWAWLARAVHNQNRMICSQLCAQAWESAGHPLPVDRPQAQDVTPSDLEWMIARRAWEPAA